MPIFDLVGSAKPLVTSGLDKHPWSIAPDGQVLAFTTNDLSLP